MVIDILKILSKTLGSTTFYTNLIADNMCQITGTCFVMVKYFCCQ